ncbi:MAG: putative transcriptional regulator [Cellvibrionaceae bacterium]|jgi:predicted transcriptional regulator
MDLGTFIGIIIGLLGLVVGFWQNRQKVQFQKIIKANNWFNFQRTNNASGILQQAIKVYKEKHSANIDMDVIDLLSRADAFEQEVYKESIRQIHFSEPDFTQKDIEKWESD